MGRLTLRGTVLGALALLTLTAGFGIRRDELVCEEAVEKLADCCPGIVDASRFNCVYAPAGCNGQPPIPPEIGEAAAACLAAASCDTVRDTFDCAQPTASLCP